jgi:hypothetical protein
MRGRKKGFIPVWPGQENSERWRRETGLLPGRDNLVARQEFRSLLDLFSYGDIFKPRSEGALTETEPFSQCSATTGVDGGCSSKSYG